MAPIGRKGLSTTAKVALGCLGVVGVTTVAGGGACLFLLARAGQRQKAEASALDATVSARVTAAELVAEYKSNEVAADSRYAGRVLEVTGRVSKVGKGPLGGAFVNLSPGQELEFREVACFLLDSVGVQNLRPGEPVVVRGKAAGLMGNVILRPCKIAEDLARAAGGPRAPAGKNPASTTGRSAPGPTPDAQPSGRPGLGASTGPPAAPADPAEARGSRPERAVLDRLAEARFGDLGLSVDDYHVRSSCPGDQDGTAAEGAVFVVAYVTVSNVGDDAVDLPHFQYDLGRYRAGLGAGLPCRADAQAFGNACWKTGGKLFPGARCDGWILFEVPQGFDPSSHTVRLTARFSTGQEHVAEWSLRR